MYQELQRTNRVGRILGFWAFLCLLSCTLPTLSAQKEGPDMDWLFAQALQSRLVSLQVTQAAGKPLPLYFSPALVDFYARRQYRSAWTSASLPQLIHSIKLLNADGLNPQDYALSQLITALPIVGLKNRDAIELRVNDELRATAAYITALFHLYFGKVDPETNLPKWQFNLQQLSDGLGESLFTAVDTAQIPQVFQLARPDHFFYQGLVKALADYRNTIEWPTLAAGPTLKPCVVDPQIAILRQRLRITGEYQSPETIKTAEELLAECVRTYPVISSSSSPMSSSENQITEVSLSSINTEISLVDSSSSTSSSVNANELFDLQLVEAVKTFQRNQYLEQDGAVGAGTRASLNISLQSRVDQIRVNLDRARALLRRIPDDLVLVDIAGFKITYYKARQAVWSSRVQVGMAYRTTPIFRSDIHTITLNPTWTVPPTILNKDVLPKVRENPDYLQEHNIRVFDAEGHQLDEHTIDWRSPGRVTLRQDAGSDAALGKAVIRFPNPYFVYLHDTPHQRLFNRSQRAFSSGCIRVERVMELVRLLLSDTPGMDSKTIQSIIRAGKTRNVSLANSVPVMLAYWTVELENNTRPLFKPDIYLRDLPALVALNQPPY